MSQRSRSRSNKDNRASKSNDSEPGPSKAKRTNSRTRAAPSGRAPSGRARGRPKRRKQPEPEADVSLDVGDGAPVLPFDMNRLENGEIEGFCNVCHLEWPRGLPVEPSCSYCGRAFHSNCLSRTYHVRKFERCPECGGVTVDGTSPKERLTLCKLAACLRSMYGKLEKAIGDLVPELKKFTCPVFRNRPHLCTIDLSIIEDRVYQNSPLYYNSTAHFFSDINWLYHNCIVFGNNSRLEKQARLLRKHVEKDLIDIDACYECYLKADRRECFVDLCEIPHPVVWAKMKGYPYWPAKVLKIIDGKANVRFFGEHEKYNVMVNDCLMASDNPNKSYRDRAGFHKALEEMEVYIRNYCDVVGLFPYMAADTPFTTGCPNYRTQRGSKRITRTSQTSSHRKRRRQHARNPANGDSTEGENIQETYVESNGGNSDIEEVSIDMAIQEPPRQAAGVPQILSVQPSASDTSPTATINHVELDFCVDRDSVPNLNEVTAVAGAPNDRVVVSMPSTSTMGISMQAGAFPSMVQQLDMSTFTMDNAVVESSGLPQMNDAVIGDTADFSSINNATRTIVEKLCVNQSMIGNPLFERTFPRAVACLAMSMQQVFSDFFRSSTDQQSLMLQNNWQVQIQELQREVAKLKNKQEELKENSTMVVNTLKKSHNKMEKRFQKKLMKAEEQSQDYQQKLDVAKKEITTIKESEQRSQEELETRLQAQEAAWEEKVQAITAAAEQKYRQLDEKYLNTQTQLGVLQTEYANVQNSLVECLKEKERLRSFLQRKSKEPSYAEFLKTISIQIENQVEHFRKNHFDAIMQLLTKTEMRCNHIKKLIGQVQASYHPNKQVIGGIVSCETESTVRVRFCHEQNAARQRESATAAAIAEGTPAADLTAASNVPISSSASTAAATTKRSHKNSKKKAHKSETKQP